MRLLRQHHDTSAFFFFLFLPLASDGSTPGSCSLPRFCVAEVPPLDAGSSIPAGFMKPLLAAAGGLGNGGIDARGSSRMSICAVFVRTFLPSFFAIEMGALNPEIETGRVWGFREPLGPPSSSADGFPSSTSGLFCGVDRQC